MNRPLTLARRLSFAAGVAAALGFGTAQAFAAPVARPKAACNQEVCSRICQAISPFGGGCTADGRCVCFI
jgi:hypothetical protein